MPVTDPGLDKPNIQALFTAPTTDTSRVITDPNALLNVASESPWFFKEGVAPEGARARLEAIRSMRAAVGPLSAALQAAVDAGAATPAEAAQLAILVAWVRRLEVEEGILARALSGGATSA